MSFQEGTDRLLQILDAAVDAALDLALGQQGKEAFDLVKPGSAGGG